MVDQPSERPHCRRNRGEDPAERVGPLRHDELEWTDPVARPLRSVATDVRHREYVVAPEQVDPVSTSD
jgi:hypothetical protein